MELYQNPDFEERGIFQTMHHPTRGEFKMPAWPVKMSGNDVPMSAALLLGEHSAGADGLAGDVRRRNRSHADEGTI